MVPETEIRLLSHIPLTPGYEHQLTFSSKATQTTFFQGKTSQVFTDFTYLKEDSTIKVPGGRDSLYACNYLMFRNKDFSTKWFYGFITKLEYVNPNTTKVHFDLDVFQTWQFDFTFRPSYVVREHTQRWNVDGSPVINTLDEGLDYGSEYETVDIENYKPYGEIFFLVIVTKAAMHYEYPGPINMVNMINPNRNGLPQPLNYYIQPFRLDGTTPNIEVGGSAYTPSPILEVLKGLFTQEGAVNNVVSIYVTEYFTNIAYVAATDTMSFSSSDYARASVSDNEAVNINTIFVKDLAAYSGTLKNFGSKYLDYTAVTESKLLMYPYTVLVLDDFKGNRVELKNEYINTSSLSLRIKGSLGTSNKVAYFPESYLNSLGDQTLGLEHGLINNNPNDLPILADMLSAYLQGNRNALDNQKSQIMFNAVVNAAQGVVGGAMSGTGGIAGGVTGAAIGAVNSYYQIEGLNAKKRDIMNTPPQAAKMGGNTSFDYGNNISGIYLIKKQITAEYRARLTDFFKMFGYKINTLKVPNLKSRNHYNYIQTKGVNLTGNVPQDDLNKLKEIFDNGATFWHGEYVGDYTLTNGEV